MSRTSFPASNRWLRALALGGFVALCLAAPLHAADRTTLAALAGETHFHGLSVAPGDPPRLYLATHHGLWLVQADGAARRVSDHGDDLMGFTPHPADPTRLYASGHPASGGNLGFVASADGGRSWRKLADGIGGPVDFHQMDVSKADPRVIYGVHGGLQKSTDGGMSWRRIGPAPEGLIALAASGRSPDTLYAATRGGLLRSGDGGRQWEKVHQAAAPATAVHVTAAGDILAYIVGTGILRASEGDGAPAWQVAGPGPEGAVILHLATAREGRAVYAVTYDQRTRRQGLAASADGGASWQPFGAAPR